MLASRLFRVFCSQKQTLNVGLNGQQQTLREAINSVEFMHEKHMSMEKDINFLRKQIIFRCTNLGMKELDLVIGQWAMENLDKMDIKQCKAFHVEILEKETPNLYKYIMGTMEIPKGSKYIPVIKEYAYNNDKKNYNKNL